MPLPRSRLAAGRSLSGADTGSPIHDLTDPGFERDVVCFQECALPEGLVKIPNDTFDVGLLVQQTRPSVAVLKKTLAGFDTQLSGINHLSQQGTGAEFGVMETIIQYQ